MKKIQHRKILVYAHWVGLPEPQLMGELNSTIVRNKEIFSFEYTDDWLQHHLNYEIDPSLKLFRGLQYAPQNHINFGIFMDSAPDRWGRMLMDRREAQLAREEGRSENKLLESDYVLGVYDLQRIGGIRYKTDQHGPFLDNNKQKAAPPWSSLRELEYASLQLEKKDAVKNPNYSKWLQMLIIPGSSLGGARPKSSILDERDHLWIAKFPSQHDDYDIGGWEMVAQKLAYRSRINVSEAKLLKFNIRHRTFLSKRFDRTIYGERIHFASAMTMLQRFDGDDHTKGASYLELAQFIIQYGTNISENLEQLWRRIVFNICISNVDDHLRNHGFILNDFGWELSPAFDINPVAGGNGLKLNISETDNSQDLLLALEVAEYFRLKSKRANAIINEIVKVVKTWRKEAASLALSSTEQDKMAAAFHVAENY